MTYHVWLGIVTGWDYMGLYGIMDEIIAGSMGSGWWLTYPSEKYESVSWDDDIPSIWKVIKVHGSKPPTSHVISCYISHKHQLYLYIYLKIIGAHVYDSYLDNIYIYTVCMYIYILVI